MRGYEIWWVNIVGVPGITMTIDQGNARDAGSKGDEEVPHSKEAANEGRQEWQKRFFLFHCSEQKAYAVFEPFQS
jgi:hypothetical protein